MATIIILAIVGIIFVLKQIHKDLKFSFNNIFIYLCGTIIGAVIGGAIGFFVAWIIPSKTEPVVSTYYLETLKDNSMIDGQFFLGSGIISGQMKYVFYYEIDDGYKMGQLNYNNTVIKYTSEKPKLEIYKKEKTDAFINNFSIYLKGCSCNNKNIIYVPKGSIKQNYTLDAQ